MVVQQVDKEEDEEIGGGISSTTIAS